MIDLWGAHKGTMRGIFLSLISLRVKKKNNCPNTITQNPLYWLSVSTIIRVLFFGVKIFVYFLK